MTRKNTSALIKMLFLIVFYTFSASPAYALAEINIEASPPAATQKSTAPSINLKPFSAKYVAFRSGNDVGNALLELKPLTGKQYVLTYESIVSRFFLTDERFEKTTFSNKLGNLVPLEYYYKRSGTGPNKTLLLNFDQLNQKIHVDESASLPWDDELDNQLFRIDFPQQLASGNTNKVYNFINYRGEKRQYQLKVMATENLTLPYGNINAIKVLIGRESPRRVTYAWFAPSLNYNLVRIQQFKDESEQGDVQLKTFKYL